MIDSDQKYEDLIKRLEKYSRESPRAYQTTVALLAILGYAYLGGVFLFALALIVSIIGGFGWLLISFHSFGAGVALAKLGIPILIGLFALISAIGKSLFIKLPSIDGPEIRPETAQRLFAMLDDVAAKLKAPRFHRVFITDEFNASVVQLPKFGFLGSNNYLIIGVPLMKALSEKHFQAVIAHELGHISRNHSRFAGWIYRQRISWMVVLSEIGGSPLIVPFLRWYAPYFSAYTFALARSDEYVADQCGAEVAGAQTMAESLVATEVRARFMEGVFWPRIFEEADNHPQPNVRPFSILFEPGGALPTPAEGAKLLQQSWASRSTSDDPHPCLAERLGALGFRASGGMTEATKPPIPLPPDPQISAAQALLGGMAPRLLEQLDQDWIRQVTKPWQEEYGKAQWGRQRLDALASKRQHEALPFDEDLERATLTARFYGDEDGLAAMYQVCEAFPQNAKPYAMMGAKLLDMGKADGIAYLDRATAMEPKLRPQAQEIIADFQRVHGPIPAGIATNLPVSTGNAGEPFKPSSIAASTPPTPEDRFIPNGLPMQTRSDIRAALASLRIPCDVYMSRRIDPANPARPQFILVLDTTQDQAGGAEALQTLVRDIPGALILPGGLFVTDREQYPWLPKILAKIQGTLIYQYKLH